MDYDYIYSDVKKPLKMVVWDLGRRCNFDCTYCTGWMHSTTAPMNNFEKYKNTADFIHKYYSIYKEHHSKDWDITISFTGGEPAINPAFYELVPYLQEKLPYVKLNLTTNGTWNRRRGQFLLDNMDSVTVSYHCEGNEIQKQLARDNLKWMREQLGDAKKSKLRVNLMMHMDYFDECVDLIENFLKPNDINYIPRTIGDDGRYRSKWFKDMDGAMRRTSHIYTSEQQDYIKNHWNKKNAEVSVKSSEKVVNPSTDDLPVTDIKKTNAIKIEQTAKDGHVNKIGRMCCGGRCMTVKRNDEVTDAMFIEQTNFEGYNCMINWFFLHIEEDRNAVYHHQTCMARFSDAPKPELNTALFGDIVNKFNDNKGPICTLDNYETYLDWLQKQFDSGKKPTMVCPNTHCGCGICIAKAKQQSDFDSIKLNYIKG